MKKFAVIQMGKNYDTLKHRALFDTGNLKVYIRTVNNFDEALTCVDELVDEGVKCIEVCGSFGEEKTRKLIEHTDGKIAIGYVTTFPEQEPLFLEFFGIKK